MPQSNAPENSLPQHASELVTENESLLSLAKGQRLGSRYIARQFLGRGGMGEVWLADEMDEGGEKVQDVVVKIIPPEVQADGAEMTKVRSSFEIVRRLRHTNICSALTLGTDKDLGVFLVMDYVDGQTLGKYQSEQPGGVFTLKQTLEMLAPLADALDFAHSQKILHRDIKPQNVMVPLRAKSTPHAEVKLIDFGLAAEIHASLVHVSLQTARHTSGTPAFMPPEQINGLPQDARTDQYALAAMAYTMLAGRPPFAATQSDALIHQILNNPPAPPENLSEHAQAAFRRALAKEKDERFASCAAFVQALATASPHFQSTAAFDGAPDSTISSARAAHAAKRKHVPWKYVLAAVCASVIGAALLYALPYFLAPEVEIAAPPAHDDSAADAAPQTDENEIHPVAEAPLPEEQPAAPAKIVVFPSDVLQRVGVSADGVTAVCSENASDTDFAHLQYIPQLARLRICDAPELTTAGLGCLKKMTQIQEIDLHSTSFSDENLEFLANLKQLRLLSLGGCKHITDKGVAKISHLEHLQILDLSDCNITDAGLRHLEGMTRLQCLRLKGCKGVTDAGTDVLKNFAGLQNLDLSETGIADESLAHLENSLQLEALFLTNCQKITDVGLIHLRKLSRLRKLGLQGCRSITDVGLANLSHMQELEELNLLACPNIADEGLGHIRKLKNLRYLEMSTCHRITDAGLARLKTLPQLCRLGIEYCRSISNEGLATICQMKEIEGLALGHNHWLTDDGLAHLKKLEKLYWLRMDNCPAITDAGLAHLQSLPNLKTLSIRKCPLITDAGVEELKKALPDCEITR